MPPTRRWLPYAAILLGVCMIATVPIFARMAQAEQMPTLVITTLRFVLAGILLTPLALTQNRGDLQRLRRRDLVLIVGAGICATLFFALYFTSLEHTSVLLASVMSGTNPLWVALMEVFILKTLLNRYVWLGLLLALAGGVLFTAANMDAGAGSNPGLGVLLALGSAFAAAALFIIARSIRARVATLPYLWVQVTAASSITLFITLLSHTALTGYSLRGYGWVLLMAISAQVIGQLAINYSLAHISATLASITLQAAVIVSAVIAFFAFQEQPGPLQIVASLIILSGIGVVAAARTLRPSAQIARG
jgi:drug/metabolite transporter (DMT)-like permease